MRKFSQENSIAAVELEQMVADYFYTLDTEGGAAAIGFFTEEVEVGLGTVSYSGHAAMKSFYEGIKERVRAEQKDGVRTLRHGFTNFRVVFSGSDRATITVLNIAFTGSGKPPLLDATTPSIVTDVRLECRLDPDGQWRIFGYYGAPVFVGSDPFLIKSMIKR